MKNSTHGFTLLELIIVAGIAAALMMLLATATANSRPNVRVIQCLANMKKLNAAWVMYTHDYSDRVPSNLSLLDTENEIARKTYRTWACDVMLWTTDWRVTNAFLLQAGLLGPYLNSDTTIYHCPSDNYLSGQQIAAGWTARARSVSMNGFFGPDLPGSGSWQSGRSDWLPAYRQWLKIGELPKPSQFFVMLEEHPDSITAGLFLDDPASTNSWSGLPASFHNGGCTISFADGRAEVHKWLSNTTKIPVYYFYNPLPSFDQLSRIDYSWLMSRATVRYGGQATRSGPNSGLVCAAQPNLSRSIQD